MTNLPTPQSRIEELMKAFITREITDVVKPQSRIEKYWYHMISGTNDLHIPQSRVENLLKKIIDNDTNNIPHAQSRIEEYLISILTGEIDNLPIPQSRSEIFLDYIARNNRPVEDIEYVSYSGTNITAYNTIEKPIKSAILKGCTGYRDIDTGEVLDAFEDGRNLELVSVKMPVLTTTGKNLCDKVENNKDIDYSTGIVLDGGRTVPVDFIPVKPNTTYTFTRPSSTKTSASRYYDKNKTYIGSGTLVLSGSFSKSFVTPANCYFMKFIDESNTLEKGYQIEESSTPTTYEPYKTNILTVNEDVTLRSNGSVCDELDLLTGKLTQRIDEDGEILTQEVVKTVDLKVVDQDGNPVNQLSAFDSTTHIISDSESDNSLIAIAEVEVPTKLIEALNAVKSLSSDVEMLINEVDNAQKLQDENSTMVMSAMTELYEMVLVMGGGS